jgi:hypothetical protein
LQTAQTGLIYGGLFYKAETQAFNNAAVAANIDADDGRANTLVRRGSALGLTERLT